MFGEWRIGVGDGHAPDAILPERQGKPGKLPLKPGAPSGLRREQRELLTGRRSRAVQFQGEPSDRRRWRSPLEAREQEALDRLGIGLITDVAPVAIAGSVLIAHVGMDRAAGYGLKLPTSFQDTHLGRMGREK